MPERGGVARPGLAARVAAAVASTGAPGSARWLAGVAAALLAAPLLWPGSFALGLLTQIGIALIACAAYQLLLGEGGLLSFGHAVYAGLGGFATMHALNRLAAGGLAPWPADALGVAALPLLGGLAGALAAAVLGWAATRHSGTAFAMITLGLGELVAAAALMLPEVFGGEGGLSGNRVLGAPVAGLHWAGAREVYGLVAAYALACLAALQWRRGRAAGRLLNAVRDNATRVGFLGTDPRGLRWRAFVVSGAWSGVAGALAALHFEQVGAESLGAQRSAALLLFVFLGGAGHPAGAALGAVGLVLAQTALSAWTPAWGLYLGAVFIGAVLWAPGGLVGALRRPAGVAGGRGGPPWHWRPAAWLGAGAAGLALLAGAVAAVEGLYRLRLDAALRPPLLAPGAALDLTQAAVWAGLGAWCAAAAALWAGLRGPLRQRRAAWVARAAGEGGAPAPGAVRAEPSQAVAMAVAPINVAEIASLRDAPEPSTAPQPVAAAEAPAASSATAPRRPAAAAPLLELRGVQRRFGRTAVLRGVDLAVREGERVAVIGPNGAGKSTLFHLVSGGLAPDAGEVRLAGRRIDGLRPWQVRRRGLSRSFQISQLMPTLTVAQHLHAALLAAPGPRRGRDARADARIDALLEQLHLQARRDQPAAQLPHAEQRALELGLAVAAEHRVLLLDEPSAGMSRSETARLIPLLRRLSEGRTLLLVEHDMGVVFGLADRVAVLVQGQVLAFDRPEVVRADPRVRRAYLGDLPGEDGGG